MNAPLPPREAERLAALQSYGLLDTPPEPGFDDLAQLAALICGTPIALVSLVDGQRQWFKSRHGLEATETPRDIAFCTHAIEGHEVFIVPDATADSRFANNPLVTSEPAIRFYAGAPLITHEGHALGTLCVIDREPRQLSSEQRNALSALARQTVTQMELRRHGQHLRELMAEREEAQHARDEMAGQLRHAQRLQAVGSLASGLAHEVDAPMQVIAENLSFAERTTETLLELLRLPAEDIEARIAAADLPFIEAQLPRAFSRCNDGVTRVSRVIDAMQRFSGTHTEMAGTDLNQCLRDTLELCKNDYRFVADVITEFGELPSVIANSGDINQVFRSLIVNAAQAIEYTGRRGRIAVRSRIDGDSVMIRIEDNGCGIEDAIRDRIFDPFFTTRVNRHAVGQGLSMAHSIVVNRHGGSLNFESVAGLGTRFTVRLPLGSSKSEEAAEEPTEVSTGA